jgi:hypothetical protein
MGDNAYWRSHYAAKASRLEAERDAARWEVERYREALELISTMNNECVQAAALAYDALHPDSE